MACHHRLKWRRALSYAPELRCGGKLTTGQGGGGGGKHLPNEAKQEWVKTANVFERDERLNNPRTQPTA